MSPTRKTRLLQEQPWCSRCGSRENLTIDHIIPQMVCKILNNIRKDSKENLQVLCQDCNKLKGHLLDPKNPNTVRLLKKYINDWIKLNVEEKPRRKYVFRNLPVQSNSETTYFVPHKQYLEDIYRRQ